MNCPACYESVPEDRARPCPHCHTVYHDACLEAAPCLVAGCEAVSEGFLPAKKSPGWLRVIEVLTVLAIIAVLAAIAVPNFKTGRLDMRPRHCYANQKTIVGAMEMYNLDKNTKRTVLDAAFFLALKSNGYLQSIPQDPGEGPGTSANYRTTENSRGITCTLHGSIQ